MNEHARRRVVSPASWPAPPAEMSVSTEAEIDECPRRWALGAAEYPDIWSGRGYPPRLQVAALAGTVVHLALEIITRHLARAQVPSLDDPLAMAVLKDLGGYTRVVEECVERVLGRFADNPRAHQVMEHARRTLRGQVPALRAQVQSMLVRLRLPRAGAQAPDVAAPSRPPSLVRGPLRRGTHPEVEVHARSIGWKGKVDLLVLGDECEITDFKTGATDEAHEFQVRVYAVLWRMDDELNPARRLVDRLVLAYQGRDVEVAPPSAPEIDEIGRDLLARRRAADSALAARPPVARPSADSCRHCGVRQLCDAYWSGAELALSDDGRLGDVELRITGRHGPTSLDAVVLRARAIRPGTPALLRFQQGHDPGTGARVRVLQGALARDPEDIDAPAIVTLGVFSEVYWVD